jgi:hypothetical protein
MGTIIVIIFYAILFRETDLSSILEELALAIDRTTTYQRVNVVRSKVLDGARRALARASFKGKERKLGFYGTPTQNSVIWCQLGQEIGWTEWLEVKTNTTRTK